MKNFSHCISTSESVLMEGALGERLKREYHLSFDAQLAMAALIYSSEGRRALKNLWQEYIHIARKYNLPFLATTPTRRANKERVEASCFTKAVIGDNVSLLRSIQQEAQIEMYVGGLMGCKGDAYTGEGALNEKEARDFHTWQAGLFQAANVDFLYAGIMPVLSEAIGMAQAMSDMGIPYIISFTIQKDGRLIDGTTIDKAISTIDASVDNRPVCYMANCVHPVIVHAALSQEFNKTSLVRNRFYGIQANTSPLSYAELDDAADLKCSDPTLLAAEMFRLKEDNALRIFGGCCGTDSRHMEAIARLL
ncbi:homocysteine S-methyltransferase family protein [uncultured Bacteroides sp.]|uniref:homocysteine S-methyltransferase family protein n=1 Tax=uncultured Bacteroides sp. TaxID=162156 RepID=UPI002AAC39F6|nr:homocysteine S-methyltransferase family protein [uncultured Bacteroides sp.]